MSTDEEVNSEWTCDQCDGEVASDDVFCPHCGERFDQRLFCSFHHSNEAIGVCVICQLPYCARCGVAVGGKFFCRPHSLYETREGMARLQWNREAATLQFVASCLEQAGLYPFTIADVDVYVSFAEVTRAEETIQELGFVVQKSPF